MPKSYTPRNQPGWAKPKLKKNGSGGPLRDQSHSFTSGRTGAGADIEVNRSTGQVERLRSSSGLREKE